ncbi:MAG: DUF6460 domain-containing protein [Hyphomicrobiaceae bacterium]
MDLRRLLGGSPLATIIKLVVMSVVVGIVLAALGIGPSEIYSRLVLIVHRIYDMGFETFEWAFRYFLLGAVIVIPIWIIARLLRLAGGKDDGRDGDRRR